MSIDATQTAEAKLAVLPTSSLRPSITETLTPMSEPMVKAILTDVPSGEATGGETVSQWCDVFSDNVINQERWQIGGDEENLIYEEDGVLNFIVLEEQSARENKDKWLSGLPEMRPIREVSFTITLLDSNDVSGATRIEVFQTGGRELNASFGPSPNGPELEFGFCPDSSCSDYGDYVHPGPPAKGPIALGTPLNTRLVWIDEKVVFYIDGFSPVEVAAAEPITNLRLSLHADQGSVFHAVIDNFCVTYEQ
jgi:hypothetical protein